MGFEQDGSHQPFERSLIMFNVTEELKKNHWCHRECRSRSTARHAPFNLPPFRRREEQLTGRSVCERKLKAGIR